MTTTTTTMISSSHRNISTTIYIVDTCRTVGGTTITHLCNIRDDRVIGHTGMANPRLGILNEMLPGSRQEQSRDVHVFGFPNDPFRRR